MQAEERCGGWRGIWQGMETAAGRASSREGTVLSLAQYRQGLRLLLCKK